MLRLFIPVGLIAVFACWVIYRLLIKKDLKQQHSGLYMGLFFTGIWGLIYFLLLH
jgi:FtsH-binding integral membrane protein